MNSRKNAENALNAPYNFSTHRRAYNKEEEEEEEEEKEEQTTSAVSAQRLRAGRSKNRNNKPGKPEAYSVS